MRKIEFSNENVKAFYQTIINEHRGISGLILKLLQDNDNIMVKDVVNTEYGAQIIFEIGNEITTIDIDYLKKKIYFKRPNTKYKEIYDNYPRKNISPSGYLYQKDNRSITKKLLFDIKNDVNNVKHYEINENGSHYSIVVTCKNYDFNEETFILKLLHAPNNFSNIRGVFITINELVNFKYFDLSIADSKGSNITVKDGEIKEYIEYYEENEHYNKIYLENNEFYIEKKVREKYEDNMTAYVKKIGERNGKEKR